jgi:predicted nucleotidyltransferase
MSTPFTNPAPYTDVNDLLRELLSSARAILADHFVGMYLFGSLAAGDFDHASDVDVLVVTDEEVSGEMLSSLRAMHARIAAAESHWATQLEVSYIPRHALRRFDPARSLHPHIDRGAGQSLRVARHDADWVIQRHVLREKGLVLAGPEPRTLIDPLTPDDLRRAVSEILRDWYAPMADDPAHLRSRGYQSYTVLTMCRMLYTLRHGAVVSKPFAARWARETLGARWAGLIERAWEGRRTPQSEPEPSDVSETTAFIRHTLELSRQFEPRGVERTDS